MENPIENNALRIETIRTPEGSEVSVCPQRGGIITSIKFQGREILYLDPVTLQDPNVNVKGGIPILFPNAGPLENPQYPNLKQHGFARNSSQWRLERMNRGFQETLVSDIDTNAVFPHDFRFSLIGSFEENGSFSIKEQVELWANGQAISIDNPGVNNPNATIEVIIPSLGTLIIDLSPEYKKIWIWSMVGKDFICIEPIMRDAGGLIENPENIPPKKTLHTRVNFKLKE